MSEIQNDLKYFSIRDAHFAFGAVWPNEITVRGGHTIKQRWANKITM